MAYAMPREIHGPAAKHDDPVHPPPQTHQQRCHNMLV